MTVTVDLEKEVIGLALLSSQALADLVMVRPEHFSMPQGENVWRLIQSMEAAGEPVDPTTLLGKIPALAKRDRAGVDGSWIAECVRLAPTGANAEYRGKQLVNAAELRALNLALIRSQQVLEGAVDAVEATELVRAEIDATVPSSRTGILLADGIPDTIAELRVETPTRRTPWADLNTIIGGFRPGALYVVGARPGVGKSIMGVQAALGLAQHGPVALNSLEMPATEIHRRMLSHVSGIPVGTFTGLQDGRDPLAGKWEEVQVARDTLASLPLSVDDRSYLTVTDIRGHARSVGRNVGLAGIVVDYLQLMSAPRGDKRPRHEVIAGISRDLKLLAKEMNCPVIALSQLNRASEHRAGGRPSLADLRESGAIEQDADVVMLLHVPEDDDGKADMGLLDVFVAKNRHGESKSFQLIRQGWISTLADKPRQLRSSSNFGNF